MSKELFFTLSLEIILFCSGIVLACALSISLRYLLCLLFSLGCHSGSLSLCLSLSNSLLLCLICRLVKALSIICKGISILSLLLAGKCTGIYGYRNDLYLVIGFLFGVNRSCAFLLRIAPPIVLLGIVLSLCYVVGSFPCLLALLPSILLRLSMHSVRITVGVEFSSLSVLGYFLRFLKLLLSVLMLLCASSKMISIAKVISIAVSNAILSEGLGLFRSAFLLVEVVIVRLGVGLLHTGGSGLIEDSGICNNYSSILLVGGELLIGLSLCRYVSISSSFCALGLLFLTSILRISFSIISIGRCTVNKCRSGCNGKGSSAYCLNNGGIGFIVFLSLDHDFGISILLLTSCLLQGLLFLNGFSMIRKEDLRVSATGVYRTRFTACGFRYCIGSYRLSRSIIIESCCHYGSREYLLTCLLSLLLCLTNLLISLVISKKHSRLKTTGIADVFNVYRTVKTVYNIAIGAICGIGVLGLGVHFARGHTYTHRYTLSVILALVVDKVGCINSQRHSKCADCGIIQFIIFSVVIENTYLCGKYRQRSVLSLCGRSRTGRSLFSSTVILLSLRFD